MKNNFSPSIILMKQFSIAMIFQKKNDWCNNFLIYDQGTSNSGQFCHKPQVYNNAQIFYRSVLNTESKLKGIFS